MFKRLPAQQAETFIKVWLRSTGCSLALAIFTQVAWGNSITSSAQTPELPNASSTDQPICSTPVLERLVTHVIQPGETLNQLAQKYDLIPATLMGFNPSLRSQQAIDQPFPDRLLGQTILIPPYNGIRVEAKPGQTWKDLANIYRVRADVLFELNGCQPKPKMVFIPGVNWSPIGSSDQPSLKPAARKILTAYPLPAPATVLLDYGWRFNPAIDQVAFHSGVDLAAPVGTKVLAAGSGTIAFAAKEGTYGNLVVINHPQGLQTRYAHLGSLQVKAGQTIKAGELLGMVGTTGIPHSKATHLHFEVRSNSSLGWVAEDPRPYLTPTISK